MEIIKEVFWSYRSNQDLIKTFSYYKQIHDSQTASRIISDLVKNTEAELIEKLDVAAIDQEFSHLGNCKKLFIGNYKISFISKGHVAYIIRVFGMKQDPDKNK